MEHQLCTHTLATNPSKTICGLCQLSGLKVVEHKFLDIQL